MRAFRSDAFQGCMIGLAVGDALGFPCEFRSRADILRSFGPGGVTDFVGLMDSRWPARPIILGAPHEPGTFSDDTQMSIAVAEALLAVAEPDIDPLLQEMARRFVLWGGSPDNNRAPGATCMSGVERLRQGAAWRDAGVPDSKGCGSAMRVAPIGLRFWQNKRHLLEVARSSSLITHGHDAAVEGAAAAALCVALALEKKSPRAMYDSVMATCAPRSADFRTCFEKLPALLEEPSELALSKEGLGEGWVAEEAVASALYCFWKSPSDFSKTVLMGANTDGDSDSIACIAGSISGAFNGLNAIPIHWREQVEGADRLMDLGLRLSC